jgi:trehalose 6-phosphate phosphatase
MEGKAVVELSVVEASKGAAVRALRERLGVDAVLFAGDDVTDETALSTLEPDRDVGVKVGEGPTAAAHRVADPEAVAALLTELADLRQGGRP